MLSKCDVILLTIVAVLAAVVGLAMWWTWEETIWKKPDGQNGQNGEPDAQRAGMEKMAACEREENAKFWKDYERRYREHLRLFGDKPESCPATPQ